MLPCLQCRLVEWVEWAEWISKLFSLEIIKKRVFSARFFCLFLVLESSFLHVEKKLLLSLFYPPSSLIVYPYSAQYITALMSPRAARHISSLFHLCLFPDFLYSTCHFSYQVHILMVHFTDPRFYDFENLQKEVEKRFCAFKPIS